MTAEISVYESSTDSRSKKQKIITSCLGRGFIPVDKSILFGEVLQFRQLGAQTMTPLVTFVGQQNGWNWPPIAEGNLMNPRGRRIKKCNKNLRK